MEEIKSIRISELKDFKNHPFHVQQDMELCALMKSIEDEGVIVPLLVRPNPDGEGCRLGWSMMKTISQVFVTGVKEITTTPALFGDVLEYEGKFYKVGTVRQEVKDTKVEDDSFYLLTLAAVAGKRRRTDQ